MLPREEEIAESFASTQDIETGIFNHPVVVISRQVHQGNVAVLVVTSFDNTPIEKRHHHPDRRLSYLPIRPASHPDHSCTLAIAHRKTMKKPSYVNIKNIHEIPFKILRECWQDDDFHLESKSYGTLIKVLWKQNVAELDIRLRGHGIFERVHQSTRVETPRSTLNLSAEERRLVRLQSTHVEIPRSTHNLSAEDRRLIRPHDLRCSGGRIGASSRTHSHGTRIHAPTEATPPSVMKAATASSMRAFDSSR
uniref:Uncharacterized protein n=1 Tax=Bionectria ochroleuca TaxID=29856 RepID=A0A8H7TT21_BIOOC